MKNSATTAKAILPQTKKPALKAPVKVSKVLSPKLSANHNETLVTR